MNDILNKFSNIGIIPVVVLDSAEDAVPLGRTLCDGGLACAEVTFRTDAAKESIKRMAKEFPDMLIGAGTILTIQQVDEAVEAGAKFIVSPGINPKVVDYCVKNNIPITPGCANPTNVETALEFGLEVVKFFPAEPAGGLPYIKAISAPYNKVKFIPTGGINAVNVKEYLAYDRILACGGSWMVKSELLKSHDFNKIKELTEEAVAIRDEIYKEKLNK